MRTFTFYLDAWRFCVSSDLPITNIEKTGYSEYTVHEKEKAMTEE